MSRLSRKRAFGVFVGVGAGVAVAVGGVSMGTAWATTSAAQSTHTAVGRAAGAARSDGSWTSVSDLVKASPKSYSRQVVCLVDKGVKISVSGSGAGRRMSVEGASHEDVAACR
ncbi:hypothetical protein ACGFT2_23760 [Streptomyces sp. NPDC048514]|uniref:hypothetical protein n=1 Tax=Streptomyces sp. NPDC048514 TaxID=3365564 RepID=UPI0037150197